MKGENVGVGICVVLPGFPRIVESPTLKAVERGRATVMLCSASGNPVPRVTWLKDLRPLDLALDSRLNLLPTGMHASHTGHTAELA